MIAAKVMVVEDERVVALHLKLQLTRLGYNVVSMATSGQQVLQQIQDVRPDIVLMDIHIEGPLDGIDTARLIPPDLELPVVYLTAFSEEATLERARETKPYGYLIKPFSERELHAAIQMVLERRRADAAVKDNEKRLEQLIAARTAELFAANNELREQMALRMRTERELHEAQKMEAIGQLTGGIAHDFNNLLTVIMGSLSRVERHSQLPVAELRRSAAIAFQASKKAAILTNQLLAFARRQPLDPKPHHLNRLVESMSETLRRSLGESVKVQTALSDSCWPVCVDANQLETTLLNIALNARDAMSANGQLKIETSNTILDEAYCSDHVPVKPGEYVMIEMTDNGAGMSKEVAAKAFEPFFTTKALGQGTGLGLSQVYGFIKQSEGHVHLSSELGIGTTVKLFLPRLNDGRAEESGAPTFETDGVPTGTSAETILVVEDDDDVRANSKGFLQELGYNVLEAPDAHSALQIISSEHPISLLFTDVGLPNGMDGCQLVDEARRLRPSLRALFTTAYAHNTIVQQRRLNPNVDLLAKPYTFAVLAKKIRLVLDHEIRAVS